MFWYRRWSWVLVFCLVTTFVYSQSIKRKRALVQEYSFRLSEMDKQQRLVCSELEYLQLKIASINDPDWIELILMRDLGVVPDGYLKVHFKGSVNHAQNY